MKEATNAIEADEVGVSPVTKTASGRENFRAFGALAASGVVLAAVGSMVVSHLQAEHRMAADDQSRGADVAPASSLSGGSLRLPAAGRPPPSGLDLAHGNRGPASGSGSVTGGGAASGFDPETDLPALARLAGVHDPLPVSSLSLGSAGASPNAASASSIVAAASPFDGPVLLTPSPAIGVPVAQVIDPVLEDGVAKARARLDESRRKLDRLLGGSGESSAGAATDETLRMSSTARIGAARLGAPALTLPRGMTFTCALANRIVSEESGLVSCVVARNVYGHDGRVLLIERGSHLDGAYRALSRIGQTRLAVAWERLRMPNGVVVDLGSPATGPLGEAGVDGFVDEHWSERIGSAVLVSLLDDAVKIEIAHEQANGNASGTLLLQGSGTESSSLAGKVLDSTVNIPPTVIKNQGEIVAVSVARDVDFSTVYELRAANP